MPAWFELHEAQFVQDLYTTSAVAALTVDLQAVPKGKVWSILVAECHPSVSETRIFQFEKVTRSSWTYPLSVAVSLTASPTFRVPLLTQGQEITLYPGEVLRAKRDAATAGSTFLIQAQFVETDLPYYRYKEAQRGIAERRRQHGYPATGIIGASRAILGSHAENEPSIGQPQTPPNTEI